MRLHYRSIFLLLFLPAVLAELILEATPAPEFFAPATLLLFTFVGYGGPVLVIREFAVRCKIGIGGIFVLGLAYGIYNEGFLAKTLLMEQNVPNPAYDHYSMLGGINTAWMAVICVYHAMCSVLFPILIVHEARPGDSGVPWLGKKLTCVLATAYFLVGIAAFLGKDKIQGTPGQLAVFLTLMAASAFIAPRLKSIGRPPYFMGKSLKPIFLGITTLLSYILVSAIADHKLPLILFAAALAALTFGYIRILKSAKYADMPSFRLFAAGVYLQSTIFGTALRVALNQERVPAMITGIAATATLIWWIRKILRDAKPIKVE